MHGELTTTFACKTIYDLVSGWLSEVIQYECATTNKAAREGSIRWWRLLIVLKI